MYPAQIFSLFPPFPRDDKVFVAMSFDHRFSARWRDVIKPAIESIRVGQTHLEANRVDTRSISDSILTEILMGITNSRLVFADITTMGMLEDKAVRNGNVMYEVGIAQAVRLPEEVILFRSDKDNLLFDTANVRVNVYSPDSDVKRARDSVVNAVENALREIDLRKHISVQKAVEMLDISGMDVLAFSSLPGGMSHPSVTPMGSILSSTALAGATSRLLEMGALRTKFINILQAVVADPGKQSAGIEYLKFELTEFGRAVLQEALRRLGVSESAIQASAKKRLATMREQANFSFDEKVQALTERIRSMGKKK